MENEKKMERYEEQQHLKEQKENWREQTRERHHQEKMSRIDKLCTMMVSTNHLVASPKKSGHNQLVVVNQNSNCTVMSPNSRSRAQVVIHLGL